MQAGIEYVTGDATSPLAEGNKVIVHVCNDVGGWGKGFVLALSKRWPQPEAYYRQWYTERNTNNFGLGAVQMVQVEAELWVANLVGQHKLHPSQGTPPIRYSAIGDGLAEVCQFASDKQASVHMPRIGCGLAGGQWEKIEPLITRELVQRGIAVTVYDFA